MTWIVLFVAIVRVVGIGWGLPASDGWDNDGVAPRDFLPGLAETFTPGAYYTYPPVHLAILAVLTLPVTLVAFLRAPSHALADVVHEIIKVPYMTSIAYVARGVSLLMSLGIVVFVARIAEEIRAHELGVTIAGVREKDKDPRVLHVKWCTAALVGVNASLTYYAHTTNLDVPYLFWATWALLVLVRALGRSEPRLVRRAFALAVLAIGTKDQAYAMFLLSIPVALAYWLWRGVAPRGDRARAVRELTIALGLAIVLFVIVDGVVFNPTGFRARVGFLTGSASQDYSEYTNDWPGRLQVLRDATKRFWFFYPNAVLVLIAGGLVVAFREARGQTDPSRRVTQTVIALLPLLVAVSFTVTFNWTARRTDARFLLPQSILLAIYGGFAMERLVFATTRTLRLVGQAAVSIALAIAIFTCIAVDANLVFDPRYDAEEWLRRHVEPGDTIETYGHNVYMPRLTAIPNVHITRVSPEPLERRNPMPDVEEIRGLYEDAPKRGARFLVVPTGWVWRYLPDPSPPGAGKQIAPTQSRSAADEEATRFFDQLVRSAGAFQIVHDAKYDDAIFPVVNVHGSTTRWVWIYERKPARAMDPEKWPPVP